uniref:Uncharacterized protein n=1 Tax=Myoviridae sp. ctNQr16 TaxID=2826644 RepID=A0A8S5MAU7_9CAUD|nr:MAG TPA: hypothetical protein [Myoviridae sp. ctNQr16]DAM30485.1 MAG TPA: hypothetical protein [Caudoviricetes sp.]
MIISELSKGFRPCRLARTAYQLLIGLFLPTGLSKHLSGYL